MSRIVLEQKIKYLETKGMPYSVACKGKCPDTGTWKVFRPEIDLGKCIKCHLCWLHCPDTAIKIREDEFVRPDLSICKGCGACAEVCPVKCIRMVEIK